MGSEACMPLDQTWSQGLVHEVTDFSWKKKKTKQKKQDELSVHFAGVKLLYMLWICGK